jgi:hypothetical protein
MKKEIPYFLYSGKGGNTLLIVGNFLSNAKLFRPLDAN